MFWERGQSVVSKSNLYIHSEKLHVCGLIRLEKRQQAPNGVTCVKPMSTNQDLITNLIAASASPQNVTFH